MRRQGYPLSSKAPIAQPLNQQSSDLLSLSLHPALPGAYDGANAIERAHKDFQDGKTDKTGVMIHYVIKDVDRGEPIVIKEIPFVPEDSDLDHLTERLHSVEHKAIVEGTRKAIESLLESTAKVKGARSAIQSLKERQLRKGASWYVLKRSTRLPLKSSMLSFMDRNGSLSTSQQRVSRERALA